MYGAISNALYYYYYYYIPESMENECWGVASGLIGHQRSFKVTTQGHLKIDGDLTKHFDWVCIRYRWESFKSGSLENDLFP